VLEKGSVLLLPLVEVAWDPSGALVADTRFWVTNDYPAGVRVRAFFMNGDRPLDADGDERAHDGWNHVEFSFPLTANQPVQWSAALGHASLAPSWGQLDPGPPPGRPEPGTGRRVLRGSVLLIAVDAAGREIRWNHLAAGAMLVDYERGTAAEGHAISFRAVDESIVNGAAMPSQGELNLDGLEYAWAPSVLQLNFFASGSMALSGGTLVVVDTTLVLHPLSMDLRANSLAVARTRAKIDVWNENETKFSGGGRCIECWDRTLLSQYGVPNHFLMAHLQSDAGKARIDGVSSVQCPQSMDLPMHGMAIRELSFVGGRRERSSAILTGMGTQATAIRLDPSPADPPEGPTPP